jgi:hypothetical protein
MALVSSLVARAQDGNVPAAGKIDLGGPDRYLTHVGTDKPIYRPGEKLYVRGVALHANKHTPLAGAQQAMVEITGPKGDVVASGSTSFEDAAAGFAWEIPQSMPGGEYTVTVSHPYTGHAPGVRKFDIRAYRAPRLKSQIVFLRDGYGPGDAVSASVHVERAEGGIPANAKVTAIARLDGNELTRSQTLIDAAGNASSQFKLPAEISHGEGSLAFVIEDGGVVETASKTIPILLQTVDISIYPEGGDLVAGLVNRVYLQALTPAKKPADIAGEVLDSAGRHVTSFRTEHEGRGRFEFKPAASETYTLKINEPAGIKTAYPLPASKQRGVVMRGEKDVFAPGEAVLLRIASASPISGTLTLRQREQQIASRKVAMGEDAAIVSLEVPDGAEGVLIATVFDDKGTPLAERLVYRQPARGVRVEVKPDKSSYVPGERASLTITTTDHGGKPISAVVGLAVSDDSIHEMIEKREQAPRLPIMVLLEQEVKDLADAHVYLDPANPKAPLATDLLLGTQGWRRFALIKVEDFISKYGDDARRVLALKVVTAMEVDRFAELGDRGVNRFFWGANRPMPAPAAAPNNEPALEGIALPGRQGQQLPQKDADGELGVLAEKLEGAQRRAMDKQIAAGGIAGKPFGSQPQRQDFVVVREYAHSARPDRKAADRVDFTETLFWHAGVKTEPKSGQATVSFALSDAVTSFRVHADAFDQSGALGSSSSTIQSIQPFYVEAKMPLEVTQGDEVLLPFVFVNATNQSFAPTAPEPVAVKGIRFGPVKPGGILPNSRRRELLYVGIGDVAGRFDVTIKGRAGDYSDQVTRTLTVKPRGFPIEFARGGLVGPEGAVSYEIEVPAELIPNSVTSELRLYPTPLANLTQALEALIQSPCGCFEQTSSTTYPLIMAQQYFMSHQGVDPKLIERSRALLDDGYNRLIGFECKKTKGFEWFGADPGHDALSAYGLLEFTDMAIVREVDPKLLASTRGFVMNSRDGKGGYKRQTHTLHTWIADPECNNGYVTWALLESRTDPKELSTETGWIKENIAKSANTYAVALGANVMALAGDPETAKSFMNKLVSKQTREGLVDGGTTSVIGSGGEALQIETTALACLAWMRDQSYAGNVENAMKWLCETCKAGRFGSTQSTILALRAIVTYDKLRARPKAPGTIQVIVDGKPMGSAVGFDGKTTGAISLQDVSEMMSPGKHVIALRMEKGAAMPFSIAVRYNTLKPGSSDQCKLTLSVALRDKEMAEGAVTEATVTVENKDSATVPTPVAIIGLPGGLEVRHDQLKELVKRQKIAAYEVMGREVVLYWRALVAGAKVELPLSLVAAIPGKYTAPASRAYLYYTDEHKTWVDPVSIAIEGK